MAKPDPYAAMMKALLLSQNAVTEHKQQKLELQEDVKRRYLDPNFEIFNPDLYEVTDADTLQKYNAEHGARIQAPEGESLDSFETRADWYADPKNRKRADNHRRTFARLFGKDVEDVSNEDMANYGQVQKARLQENKEMLRGQLVERTGKDYYGKRDLLKFEDYEAFDQAMGLEGNASYFAPSNWARIQRDLNSGELQETYGEKRTKKKAALDQVGNIIHDGGQLLNSILQAGAVVTGFGDETAEFFHRNQEHIEKFKRWAVSDAQLFREQMAEKEERLINEGMFDVRKQKYIKEGDSETKAHLKAMRDEMGDKVEYLWENPGRALDAIFGSLPAMAGVAGVGAIAVRKAAKEIAEETSRRVVARTSAAQLQNMTKEELSDYAKTATRKYFASKAGQKYLKGLTAKTGITTVGVMEGTSNASEVFASILTMSPEEAMESEKYRAMLEQGKSHEEALSSLAHSAFGQTLVTTAAIAAAAAAGTGVGAFEARLLTNTVKPAAGKAAAKTTASTATKAATPAVEKGVKAQVKKAATKTAKVTKDIVKPGLQEAPEEFIQEGGGQLMQQIAQARQGLMDPEDVGKGVGGAAVEGAVAGFGAGAGAQTLKKASRLGLKGATKGVQKATELARSSGEDIKVKNVVQSGGSGGAAGGSRVTVGGDTQAAYEDVATKISDGTYSPKDSFDETIKMLEQGGVPDTSGKKPKGKQMDASFIAALRQHAANAYKWLDDNIANATEPDAIKAWTEAKEEIRSQVEEKVGLYKGHLAREVAKGMASKSRSDEFIAALKEGYALGIVAPQDYQEAERWLAKGSEQSQTKRRVLHQARVVVDNVRKAVAAERKMAEMIMKAWRTNKVDNSGREQSLLKVVEEKMGDVTFLKGESKQVFRGLQAWTGYLQSLLDNGEFDKFDQEYATFNRRFAEYEIERAKIFRRKWEEAKAAGKPYFQVRNNSYSVAPESNTYGPFRWSAKEMADVLDGEADAIGKVRDALATQRQLLKGDAKQNTQQDGTSTSTSTEGGPAAAGPEPAKRATGPVGRKGRPAWQKLSQMEGRDQVRMRLIKGAAQGDLIPTGEYTYVKDAGPQKVVIRDNEGNESTVLKRNLEYVPEPKQESQKTVRQQDIPSDRGTSQTTDETGPQENQEPTKSVIDVWWGGGEKNVLSNLALRVFTMTPVFLKNLRIKGVPDGNVIFYSVEHAYQVLKSGTFDNEVHQKYLEGFKKGNPGKIVGKLGTRIAGNWNITLMAHLMKSSFEQDLNARRALLNTGNSEFSHTKGDKIWAERFPEILTRVRSAIKKQTTEDANRPLPSKTEAMNFYHGMSWKGKTYQMRAGVMKYMKRLFGLPADAEVTFSTIDLILAGKRTATSRNYRPGVKRGDRIAFFDKRTGSKVEVEVTTDPYRVGDISQTEWSALEGWSTQHYNPDMWQYRYRVVRVLKATPGQKTIMQGGVDKVRDQAPQESVVDKDEQRAQRQRVRKQQRAANKASQKLMSLKSLDNMVARLEAIIDLVDQVVADPSMLDESLKTLPEGIQAQINPLLASGVDPVVALQTALRNWRGLAVETLMREQGKKGANEQALQALIDRADRRTQAGPKPLLSLNMDELVQKLDDTVQSEELDAAKEDENTQLWEDEYDRVDAMLKQLEAKDPENKELKEIRNSLDQGFNQRRTKQFVRRVGEINRRYVDSLNVVTKEEVNTLPAEFRNMAQTLRQWTSRNADSIKARNQLLQRWVSEFQNGGEITSERLLELQAMAFKEGLEFFKEHGWPTSKETVYGTGLSIDNLYELFSDWRNRKKFQQGLYNLPDAISDIMGFKNKIPTSFLAVIPNLSQMLSTPGLKETLLAPMDLSGSEQLALVKALEFHSEFREKLLERLPELNDPADEGSPGYAPKNQNGDPVPGAYAHERFQKDMIHFLRDETGALNENAIFAMSMGAFSWLGTQGGGTLFNTERDINALMGLPGDSPVGKELLEWLGDAGSRMERVADSMSKDMMKMLNTKTIKADSGLSRDRLRMGMGLHALRVIQEMGLITMPKVRASDIEDVTGRYTDTDISEAEVEGGVFEDVGEQGERLLNFVRIAGEPDPADPENITLSEANQEIETAMRTGKSLFERLLGMQPSLKEPLSEEPTDADVPKKFQRSLMDLPAKLREMIGKMTDRSWEMSQSSSAMLMLDKAGMLKAAGYVNSEELQNKHITERKSIQASNNKLSRDWDTLQRFAKERDGKKFWFSYFVGANGRTMMESNTVNPQRDKTWHRFGIAMSEWKKEVVKKDGKKLDMFKATVALGLDIGVDKLGLKESVAELETLMEQPVFAEAVEVLQEHLRNPAEAIPMDQQQKIFAAIKEGGHGGHTFSALYAWAQYQNTEDGGSFTTDLMMEIDGITNGFAANILQMPTYREDEKSKIKKMLRAVGVIFKGDNISSYSQFVANGGVDNYKDLALTTGNSLIKRIGGNTMYRRRIDGGEVVYDDIPIDEAIQSKTQEIERTHQAIYNQQVAGMGTDLTVRKMERLERELAQFLVQKSSTERLYRSGLMQKLLNDDNRTVSDEGRKWAKTPFMPTMYSSGMKSVVRGIEKKAEADFYNKLVDAKTPEDRRQLLETMMEIINNVRVAEYEAYVAALDVNTEPGPMGPLLDRQWVDALMELPATDIVLEPANVAAFQTAVAATYGVAVTEGLEDKVGWQKESNTYIHNAHKLSNTIFVMDYNRRVSEYMDNNSGRYPGEDEQVAILQAMKAEGVIPSVKTVHSEGLNDRLEVTNYEPLRPEANGKILADARVQTYFNEKLQLSPGVMERSGILNEKEAPPNRSIATDVRLQLPTNDIGVSGKVKTIQSMDGAINAEMFGEYAALNVFDAAGIAYDEYMDVGQFMNQKFLEMHGQYNVMQEAFDSLKRMLTLLDPNDPRLDQDQKIEIKQEFEKVLNPYDFTEQIGLDEWVEKFQIEIRDVTEAKEALFQEIEKIEQFSAEGTVYDVDGNTQLPGGVTGSPLLVKSPADLVKDFVDWLINDKSQERNQDELIIQDLVKADAMGRLDEKLSAVIKQYQPNAERMLKLLETTFRRRNKENSRRVVSSLAGLVKNRGLGQVQLFGMRSTESFGKTVFVGDKSRIEINTRTVRNIEDGDPTVFETVLHEIYHVGLEPSIQKLSDKQAEQLYQKALEVLKKAYAEERKRGEYRNEKAMNRFKHTADVMKGLHRRGDVKGALSEFMVYSQTGLTSTEGRFIKDDMQNFLKEVEGGQELYRMLRDITRTLTRMQDSRKKNKKGTFQATSEPIRDTLFDLRYRNVSDTDTVRRLFEDFVQLDQVQPDREHDAHLDQVIEDLILPGVASLERVYHQLRTDPNGDQNLGRYSTNDNTVLLQAAGNRLTAPGSMSLKEVGVHEYLHAILEWAIDNDPMIRKELQRIYDQAKANLTVDDFLPDNVNDPAIARAIAQDRYNYIFHNPAGNNLHEFAAIALSNKQLIGALQKLDNVETQKPIWEGYTLATLLNLLSRAVSLLMGKIHNSREGTLHSGMTNLATSIIKINEVNKNRLHQAQTTPVLDKANNAVVDALVRWIVSPLERLGGPMTKYAHKRTQAQTAHMKAQGTQVLPLSEIDWKATGAAALGVTTTLHTREFQQMFNEYLKFMGMAKNNMFFELADELAPMRQNRYSWYDLLRKSKHLIDVIRKRVMEHTQHAVMQNFDPKKKWNVKERVAMTNVLLKGDLAALVDDYRDVPKVVDLLRDVGLRQTEKTRLLDEIKTLLGKNGQLTDVFENQARGLGFYMQNSYARQRNQMRNAYAIVKQFMFDEQDAIPLQNESELVKLVDKLASLYAMDYMKQEDLDLAMPIIEHELSRGAENGIEGTIGMHQTFKGEALDKLFKGNPTQMHKGYVYEEFNPDISVEVAPDTPEMEAEMKEKGFKKAHALPRDQVENIALPGRATMALYVGYTGVATYQKSIVSVTDIAHRGTDLLESIQKSDYQGNYNLILDDFRDASTAMAYRDQFKKGHEDKSVVMIPVLDEKGNIASYTYTMSEEAKVKYLKKEDKFDRALGRMFASIEDRTESVKINREVVDEMHAEWMRIGSDHPEHTMVAFGPHSKDPRTAEIYKLLPQDMKDYIRQKFGSDTFFIRSDLVNLVFGFRKLALSNAKGLPKGNAIIRIADKIWQEIVQFSKFKMVVLNPLVALGNIVSNIALLMSDGIPLKYILKEVNNAIYSMRRYQKDLIEFDQLNYKIKQREKLGRTVTAADRSRLAELEVNMKASPVAEMVEGGLVTSIVTDFEPDDMSYKQKLVNKITDKTVGKAMPEKMVKGVKELWMLPGSKGFEMAVAATQYGDFVGRYVKYKYDTQVRKKNKQESLYQALSLFIWYDLPQNRLLQAANDYGFAMFTKFFLRSQHVVLKVFGKKPATAFTTLMLQKQFMPGTLDDNYADYAFMSGFENKLSPFPWNNIFRGDLLKPAALDWIPLL